MARNLRRANPYEIMWVIVMFDLPVSSKADMRRATGFRNNLLELGFSRKQFSVYMRHAENLEKAKNIAQKVKNCLASDGMVTVMYITDRQYGMVENYFGKKKTKNEAKVLQKQEQLLLF